MAEKMEPAQYGNQRGLSIQHYLIKMVNRILTALDNNSRRQTFAIVANLIDWNNAFPRQCPKLGIEAFLENALYILDLDTLQDRRKQLCLTFAQKCLRNKKTQQMFPLNSNTHSMNNRNTEICYLQHANTGRLKDSSIIYMQHLLNENEESRKT